MTDFRKEGKALIWELNGERVKIQSWGRDGIRVQATKNPDWVDRPDALAADRSVAGKITIAAGQAIVRNGQIEARIDKEGLIGFYRSDGSVLLEESYSSPRFPSLYPLSRFYRSLGSERWHLEQRFKSFDGEKFFGLGQHRHGCFDQKGCVIELFPRNAEVGIPFAYSSRGYGFLWNDPAVGRVELGANRTRWVAETSRQIDYLVFAGQTPAEILERYVDATGHAPVLPEWAAGFWQCKLRYRTQAELLQVAREYKKRGLPLSVIVIDFFHWTKVGEWKFDPACWPDPAGMVKELNKIGVKVMVSVWPAVNPNCANYQEMLKKGFLASAERGIHLLMPFGDNNTPGTVYITYYDPTNPDARKYVWGKVRDNYFRHGIKVWWLDGCEPEIYPIDFDNIRYQAGNGMEIGNIYPRENQRAFYEGMTAEGEKEIVTLCRSAWAGSQRYGAAVWSGDIPSTFEMFQIQIRAGLNMMMSGIPWWTTDIGGFADGDIRTPEFRELIVRWFQYGVFCPLFRLHGVRTPLAKTGVNGAPNEIWSFGEKAYRIIRELLFLRERLKPYIMAQMKLASAKGTPVMRPLFFDFSADPASFAIEDEFMFGPDLLVAPVSVKGARTRQVYLPAGSFWNDAWTGEKFRGGQWLEAPAPLEKIPVYLRSGAKVKING